MRAILVFLIFLLLFFTFTPTFGQEWITDNNFESKINEKQAFGDNQNKPVIVEFYAKFNDANKFDQWQELTDVIYYRADIAVCPTAKKKYRVRMAPTLIIFKDGINELLHNIDNWKDAPLWDQKKIQRATKLWFKHLS